MFVELSLSKLPYALLDRLLCRGRPTSIVTTIAKESLDVVSTEEPIPTRHWDKKPACHGLEGLEQGQKKIIIKGIASRL